MLSFFFVVRDLDLRLRSKLEGFWSSSESEYCFSGGSDLGRGSLGGAYRRDRERQSSVATQQCFTDSLERLYLQMNLND